MAPLADQLAALGLRYCARQLDDVVALATKRRWSATQLLEHLVESEHQERTRRSLERRLARSRLGRFTPMSDFDWAWPTRIDRAAIEAVLRLDFLADARNVVLVAAQGLGKTMIAQNIFNRTIGRGLQDGHTPGTIEFKRLQQTSMVVEMTPHYRAQFRPQWTKAKLDRFLGRQVKVVGQLMLDNDHTVPRDNCADPQADQTHCWRMTAWEVHPVIRLEICTTTAVCSRNSPAWRAVEEMP